MHASITEDSGLSSGVPSLTLYDKVPMAVNFENSDRILLLTNLDIEPALEQPMRDSYDSFPYQKL